MGKNSSVIPEGYVGELRHVGKPPMLRLMVVSGTRVAFVNRVSMRVMDSFRSPRAYNRSTISPTEEHTMKATLKQLAYGAAIALLAASCTAGGEAETVVSNLESRAGSTVTGTATFTVSGEMVNLRLEITGATPGKHGVHLHTVGDCSAPDATSAMGHWDIAGGTPHGHPTAAAHHTGDCGNIEIGADGKGTLSITNAWSIGTDLIDDIGGRAIIFHAAEDDGMTQMPPGNAGARQACGVIPKA